MADDVHYMATVHLDDAGVHVRFVVPPDQDPVDVHVPARRDSALYRLLQMAHDLDDHRYRHAGVRLLVEAVGKAIDRDGLQFDARFHHNGDEVGTIILVPVLAH